MLSYRGPNAAGGVSSALTEIFSRENFKDWWYLKDDHLCRQSARTIRNFPPLSESLKDAHYRYCNNFLWPVLHDLPEFAHYDATEHQCYRDFNSTVGALTAQSQTPGQLWFVNDYQFANIPKLMQPETDSIMFWHIPWPKTIRQDHLAPMLETASAMLDASVLGFHTQEYLDNFLGFIEENLPHIHVKRKGQSIFSIAKSGYTSSVHGYNRTTILTAAPLGVDYGFWKDSSKREPLRAAIELKLPFVLSVDRCDYTKGFLERFQSIEIFFDRHSEWIEKIHFLQIGARSRPGLTEFDRYWQTCLNQANKINSRFGTSQWEPLIWSDTPMSSNELAQLYSRADLMLVNPLRDGLNLTAKEFAASQHSKPGVLGLSTGAGAWHELKDGCFTVDPTDPLTFAEEINNCFTVSETEKYRMHHKLKEQLKNNSIQTWWQKLYRLYTPSSADSAQVCS